MFLSSNNPYWNKSFFEFFLIFFKRIYLFFSRSEAIDHLTIDEMQIFVLSAIAISCALVGTFLVLKKVTMLANSLSHTVLLGIVITCCLCSSSWQLFSFLKNPTILFISAFLSALLTVIFTQFITQVLRLQEDASIGLVFVAFFSLGIVLVSLFTKNVHIGVELVMGNVEILKKEDLIVVGYIVLFNISIISLFYKELQITTFDPILAKIFGLSCLFFNYLIMVQTAVTILVSFRIVGVILVLSFLVSPVLIARLFTDKLIKVLIYSCIVGVSVSFFGVALSRHLLSKYHLALSTSGLIVIILAMIYFVCIFLSPKKGFVFLTLFKRRKNFQKEYIRG